VDVALQEDNGPGVGQGGRRRFGQRVAHHHQRDFPALSRVEQDFDPELVRTGLQLADVCRDVFEMVALAEAGGLRLGWQQDVG